MIGDEKEKGSDKQQDTGDFAEHPVEESNQKWVSTNPPPPKPKPGEGKGEA